MQGPHLDSNVKGTPRHVCRCPRTFNAHQNTSAPGCGRLANVLSEPPNKNVRHTAYHAHALFISDTPQVTSRVGTECPCAAGRKWRRSCRTFWCPPISQSVNLGPVGPSARSPTRGGSRVGRWFGARSEVGLVISDPKYRSGRGQRSSLQT